MLFIKQLKQVKKSSFNIFLPKIKGFFKILFIKSVISTKENSPQVTPQRESNLCRASRGDFSFVEMTNFACLLFVLFRNKKSFKSFNLWQKNLSLFAFPIAIGIANFAVNLLQTAMQNTNRMLRFTLRSIINLMTTTCSRSSNFYIFGSIANFWK